MNLAIIQARMTSTRFPGKPLAEIAGKPMLKRVIDQVNQAKLVDYVVVAPPGSGGGEAIRGHCREWEAACMVSPHQEWDVLARVVSVAEQIADSNLVVRVCGDNPFVDPRGIDALIEASEKSGADYTGYQSEDGTPMITVPSGWFAEVVKLGALRRLDRMLERRYSSARENVTEVLYSDAAAKNCHWLPLPSWYVDNNLPNASIDRPEDIERLEEWLSEFDSEEDWPWKQ